MKFAGIALLLMGFAELVMGLTPTVPEISPATGLSAVVLLAGAALVIRSRSRS